MVGLSNSSLSPLRLPVGVREEDILHGWDSNTLDPRITVICHTYNHREYIADAIESVLAQRTECAFELIIHDDASMDGTTDIVRKYEKRFPKLVRAIVQSENQYSQGVKPPKFTYPRIKGEFVAFCDGDDFWLDELKLARQMQALRRNSSVNLCVHKGYEINVQRGTVSVHCDHGEKEYSFDSDTVVRAHSQLFPTASLMMRHAVIADLPAWFTEEKYRPYGDYFLRVYASLNGAIYLPKIMSAYRRGVVGSYTDRMANRRSHDLLIDFKRTIYFNRKLIGVEGVSSKAIEERLAHIRYEYVSRAFALGDYRLFRLASSDLFVSMRSKLGIAILVAGFGKSPFKLASKLYQRRQFKHDCAVWIRKRCGNKIG